MPPTPNDLRQLTSDVTYKNLSTNDELIDYLKDTDAETGLNGTGTSVSEITDRMGIGFRHLAAVETSFQDIDTSTDIEKILVQDLQVIELVDTESSSYLNNSSLQIQVDSYGVQSDLYNLTNRNLEVEYSNPTSIDVHNHRSTNHRLNMRNGSGNFLSSEAGIVHGHDHDWDQHSLGASRQPTVDDVATGRLRWDNLATANKPEDQWEVTFDETTIVYDGNSDLCGFRAGVVRLTYTSSNDEVTKSLTVGGASSTGPDLTAYPLYNQGLSGESVASFFSGLDHHKIVHETSVEVKIGDHDGSGSDTNGSYSFTEDTGDLTADEISIDLSLSNFNDLANQADDETWHGADISFDISAGRIETTSSETTNYGGMSGDPTASSQFVNTNFNPPQTQLPKFATDNNPNSSWVSNRANSNNKYYDFTALIASPQNQPNGAYLGTTVTSTNLGMISGEWIQITLTNVAAVTKIIIDQRKVHKYSFVGSNNLSNNWNVIKSDSLMYSQSAQTITFTNTTTYKYYRFIVTTIYYNVNNTNEGGFSIASIDFYNDTRNVLAGYTETVFSDILPSGIEILDTYAEKLDASGYNSDYVITLDSTTRERVEVTSSGSVISVRKDDESVSVVDASGNEVAEIDIQYTADGYTNGLAGSDLTLQDPSHNLVYNRRPTTLNWSDADRLEWQSTYRALNGSGIEWHYSEDPLGFGVQPTFYTSDAPTDAFVVVVQSTLDLTEDSDVLDASGNSMERPGLVDVSDNFDRTVRINVTGTNVNLSAQSDHLLGITFTDPADKLETFTIDSSGVELVAIEGETKHTNYIDSGVFKGASLVDADNKSFQVTTTWVGQSSAPSVVLENRPYTVTLSYGDASVVVPQNEISENTDYTFTTSESSEPVTATQKLDYSLPARFTQSRVTERTRTTTFSKYDLTLTLPGFSKVKLRYSGLVFTSKTYSIEFYDLKQDAWHVQSNSKLQYFKIGGADIQHARTVEFNGVDYEPDVNGLVGLPVTLTFTEATYESIRVDFYSESAPTTSLGFHHLDHRDTRGNDFFVTGVGTFEIENNYGNDFTAEADERYFVKLAREDDSTIFSARLFLFINGTLIPRQVSGVNGILTISQFTALNAHSSSRELDVKAERDPGTQLSLQSRLTVTVTDQSSDFTATFQTEENWNMQQGMALYYNPKLTVTFDGTVQSLTVDGALQDLYDGSSVYPGIKVKHSDTTTFRSWLLANVNTTDYPTVLTLLPDRFSATLATGVTESLKEIDLNVLYFGDGYNSSTAIAQPFRFIENHRGYASEIYTLSRIPANMQITSLDKNNNTLSQSVPNLYAGKTFSVVLTRTGVSIDFIKVAETTVSNLARDGSGNPVHPSWTFSITAATITINISPGLGALLYLASHFPNYTNNVNYLTYSTNLKNLDGIKNNLNSGIRIKRFVIDQHVNLSAVFDKNDVFVHFSDMASDTNSHVTTAVASRTYTELTGVYSVGSHAVPQEAFFANGGDGILISHHRYSFDQDTWNNRSYTAYLVYLPGRHYSSSYSKALSLPVNTSTATKIVRHSFMPINGGAFGSNTFGDDSSNVPEHTFTRKNTYLKTPLQLKAATNANEVTIKMTSNKIKITQRSTSGNSDVWYNYLESIFNERRTTDDLTFYSSQTTIANATLLKSGFPQNTVSNSINIVFRMQQDNTSVLTAPRGVTSNDDVYNLTLQITNTVVVYDVTDASTNVLKVKRQNSGSNSAITVNTSVTDYNNYDNGAFKFGGFQGYQIKLTPDALNDYNFYFIEDSLGGRSVFRVTCSSVNLAAIPLGQYFQPYATAIHYLDPSGNWGSLDPSDNLLDIVNTSVDFSIRVDTDEKKNAFLRTFMSTVNVPDRYVAIENKDILRVKDCNGNEVFSIAGGGIVAAPYGIFNRLKVTGSANDNIVTSQDNTYSHSYLDMFGLRPV